MKTITIRAFVFALALTGVTAVAHSRATNHVVVASAAGVPIPMCPPNDPNGCGID